MNIRLLFYFEKYVGFLRAKYLSVPLVELVVLCLGYYTFALPESTVYSLARPEVPNVCEPISIRGVYDVAKCRYGIEYEFLRSS